MELSARRLAQAYRQVGIRCSLLTSLSYYSADGCHRKALMTAPLNATWVQQTKIASSSLDLFEDVDAILQLLRLPGKHSDRGNN